ncbi:MAG: DUF1127 domain-containing protein, partial [Candidatus Competibacteraceae bacterium]|nr:DUF1127 domain-containing protein [Candidatus Competibacteraceae bacterium]
LAMTAANRQFYLQQQARRSRAETLEVLLGGIAEMFSFAKFKAWRQRRAYIRELMELDDHALADIGLVRGDLREIARGTFDPAIRQTRRTWALRQSYQVDADAPSSVDRAA